MNIKVVGVDLEKKRVPDLCFAGRRQCGLESKGSQNQTTECYLGNPYRYGSLTDSPLLGAYVRSYGVLR